MKGKKPIKAKKITTPQTKRLYLPDDEPVKINMPFENAVKKALIPQLRR
jgi:hypothetical protein